MLGSMPIDRQYATLRSVRFLETRAVCSSMRLFWVIGNDRSQTEEQP
ncbi:MAG: hypothetical protein HC769_27910 [Cyanobacteria bacterium CRU_2_1]|nr:hypothetical protein [Cyanobacteria bacterium RU_5_0]NJR62308.1 hypothetical protein [Cyanobacteria bacterium CRU_2_1]